MQNQSNMQGGGSQSGGSQGGSMQGGSMQGGGMRGQGGSGYTMSNVNYDLVSALYHCSEAIKVYQRYLQDASGSQDQDVAQLFQQLLQDNQQLSRKLEQMIAKRVQSNNWTQ